MTTNKNYDVEKQSDRRQRRSYQDDYFDYSPRGQWLRAAVLGANDGLIAVACLLISVGDMEDDKPKFLLSLAYVVVGSISLAVREYISVYSQLDVELAQMKRDHNRMQRNQDEQSKRRLPNPLQVAIVACITFLAGAVAPLLAGSFIMDKHVRSGVVVATVSVGLVVFGWVWSVIGGSPAMKSCFRVLFGGLMALGITFGQKIIIESG
ncbi:hypothetical protein R6Q59_007833 [Mikania micrantha]|uniref:Vacuolar iron transporter n=1 Tax=Mikania micrantha TaxID=192012 RepID=A0A5N6Q159_9ASTR|nr:hypothetical protein E3N88_01510 [Mikania micrantha]